MGEPNLVPTQKSRTVGRYAIHEAIARGGMATIHVGTLLGPVGFSRTVAIKRLHEGFAHDPDFVAMLLDEARLAGRISHPNVVSTLDVVAESGEVFLVMDYVPGESVASLARILASKNELIPLRILSAILVGALSGLHAAHEARNERGEPLAIVHRDMSPQNILLGADGNPRVIDFGVAKAAARIQITQDGQIKGKLRYMAPEQVTGAELTRAIDIFAVGVILWELSTGMRLRDGESTGEIAMAILDGLFPSPQEALAASGRTLDDLQEKYLPEIEKVILRATAMNPEERYATAKDMARELADRVPTATAAEVADWIESIAGSELKVRAEVVANVERASANASGETRPSEVMRALSASRPDAIEVAISGGSGVIKSPMVKELSPTAWTEAERNHEPAPPSRGPNTSQKTVVLVAIFLCLGAFFLWLAGSDRTKADLRIDSGTLGLASSTTMSSGSLPAASLDAAIVEDAGPQSSSVDAGPALSSSAGPRFVPATPCQPFTYDEQGVKRYNPDCVH
jgi:eukaryotic-like serine/threonine-protein kinase